MSLPVPRLLAAACVILLASPSAVAGTLVRPFSMRGAAVINTGIEPGQTWFDSDANPVAMPAFDPALGPLTGWQIQQEGTWSISLRGDYYDYGTPGPVSFSFSGSTFFRITIDTAGDTDLLLAELGTFSTPVEQCSGIAGCGLVLETAASGIASFDSGVLDAALLPAAGLDPQQWWFLYIQTQVGASAHDANGDDPYLGVGTGGVLDMSGTITFFYTPEPGVAALVAAGLGSIAAGRRRGRPVGR